jgi:hypothetical protein
MTEKICPECNGEGVVDQGTEEPLRDVQRIWRCPRWARARRGVEYAAGDDGEPDRLSPRALARQ